MTEALDFGGRPRAEVITGDCREAMARMAPRSVDAICTDPPYGLSFLGAKWDHAVPGPEFWAAALRIAKPGAHLLAFGAPKLYHRLACAIEDAGWEMRDSIAWMFGTGFPKHSAALKPAREDIVVARAPFRGAAKRCVEEHGTGSLNIEACRIGDGHDRAQGGLNRAMGYSGGGSGQAVRPTGGRHPANVVLDEAMAEALDEQTGERRSGGHVTQHERSSVRGFASKQALRWEGYGDSGGASRFFYCAKASTREREAGLGAPKGERANRHPTVKPIALMRWLVRLVTPPGGLVLDPFTGSGSTGCAAALEGFDFLGIEQDPEHAELARKRIAHWGSL